MALHALLIGVNNYHPNSTVRPLSGCENDVNAVKKFLSQHYSSQIPDDNHIRLLLNEQATRTNVIAGFREHLAAAGPGDTAFVYFSGHGAQNQTATEFMPFVTDKKEEGWVLYDSRVPGSFDLADKEIALLLEEVGRSGADITVIADSCHSGSVTRNAEDFMGWTSRFIPGNKEPRPLESYLDGAYKKRLAETGILAVPYTRHILYAACDKAEVAWESDEKCGVFTRALLEALEPFGGALDYGETFTQACAAIRLITRQQNPQAEAIGGFNPHSGFLGKPVPAGRRKRYEVFTNPEQGDWRIKLGAAQGLASDMSEVVRLELFNDPAQGASVGTASLTSIGVTESYLEPGETRLHPLKTYWAEPLTMPFAPFIVYCKAPETAKLVQQALDERNESAVLLSDKPDGCIIEIRTTDGNLTLHAPGKAPLVHGVMGTDETAQTYLLKVLDHLAHWSRVHKLDNPKTQLPREAVQLGMFLQKDGEWQTLQGDKAILPFNGQRINFRVTAGNQTGQDLYLALVYLDPRFGMQVLWSSTGPVPSGTAGLQIFENFFALPPGADEELDTLKLVVSTDPIEQTAFSRPGLKPILIDPRNLGGYRSMGLLTEPDWFAHTLLVRILRDSAESTVGETPLSLAGGQVTIGQHPAFRSGFALPGPGAKGADPIVIDHPYFQNNPVFKPLALSEAALFIDLTNIQNSSELAAQPLEIVLKPNDRDSLILLFRFDGNNFIPAGKSLTDADSTFKVQIHDIPEEAPQIATRSLGSAIRLYFFSFIKDKLLKALEQVTPAASQTVPPPPFIITGNGGAFLLPENAPGITNQTILSENQ